MLSFSELMVYNIIVVITDSAKTFHLYVQILTFFKTLKSHNFIVPLVRNLSSIILVKKLVELSGLYSCFYKAV